MQESNDAVHPGTHRQTSVHPIFVLGRKLDELFVQQYDRIAFHNDEEQNGYRCQEDRLSTLMLDRTLPDEKHVEHAQAILALADKYEGSFLRSLDELNASIERHLAAFENALESLPGEIGQISPDVAAVLEDLRRWLSLSKELLTARLAAARTIKTRLECDRYIPNVIIKNEGRPDVTLSAEESAEFQAMLGGVSAILKQSSEDNKRIEAERAPLSKQLFSDDNTAKKATNPPPQIHPDISNELKAVHHLKGKAWFRLVKVFYVCLWIFVSGVCLLGGLSSGNTAVALSAFFIAALVLIGLRKAFYYVALGRTTAQERPGSGYLDWDDLSASFEDFRATNPEMHAAIVEPFLTTWKQQYGRRVPMHAFETLRKRLDTELEQLRRKKKRVVDDAAKNGKTIDIASLRETMEKTKTEYEGTDRAAYIRAADAWIMKLEAAYGTSIPVDEAAKLLDELEQTIRDKEK